MLQDYTVVSFWLKFDMFNPKFIYRQDIHK